MVTRSIDELLRELDRNGFTRGGVAKKMFVHFATNSYYIGQKRSLPVESQKANSIVDLSALHEESLDLTGLDDLFQWASEMVAEGLDVKARKARDQKVKRQVLSIIHRSAEMQAKSKYTDELSYLHRRVIALQSALSEKTDELCNLKQLVMAQYINLQRIPELEEKLLQLESSAKKELEIEEERKHLMTALAKLKTERDLLDELVSTNEAENVRVAELLRQSREESEKLKNRRWWHFLTSFRAKN